MIPHLSPQHSRFLLPGVLLSALLLQAVSPVLAAHWVDLPSTKNGVKVAVDEDSLQQKGNTRQVTERFIFNSPRPFRNAQLPELKGKTFQILEADRLYDCEKNQGRPLHIRFYSMDGKPIVKIQDAGPWDSPPPGTPSYSPMDWVCKRQTITTSKDNKKETDQHPETSGATQPASAPQTVQTAQPEQSKTAPAVPESLNMAQPASQLPVSNKPRFFVSGHDR